MAGVVDGPVEIAVLAELQQRATLAVVEIDLLSAQKAGPEANTMLSTILSAMKLLRSTNSSENKCLHPMLYQRVYEFLTRIM